MVSEDFLTANANRDFIAAQLTELVRDLIRSVVAVSERNGGAYRAGERIELVTALLARCDGRVSWSSLFSTAVSNLRDWETYHPVDEAILQAAQTGMSLCIESSCTDNAARGRTSKRQSSFLTAIAAIEHAREYARQKRWD